jgi:hypothetical protein
MKVNLKITSVHFDADKKLLEFIIHLQSVRNSGLFLLYKPM